MKIDYEGITIEAFKRTDTERNCLTINVKQGDKYLSVMHIDLSKNKENQTDEQDKQSN